ncbi:hypothetical protein [Candidatus Endomicrobiellum trichonymphae]|uniref:hypothetical protein n=1 Tax=Endomicrobium trichonymphae TaxID=1408204 RepID=UPI00155247C5|nr:hypothetical protein [Candidatus Endomicrobium trichonymphae]
MKAILAETTMFMAIINIVAFAANSSATKQPGIKKLYTMNNAQSTQTIDTPHPM